MRTISTLPYDAHNKPDTANGKIGGNEGPPAYQDRVREIELETQLSNWANELMRPFDQKMAKIRNMQHTPEYMQCQLTLKELKDCIVYNFWWPSSFVIYNSHTERLCNNERLHSSFRRSSAKYWRAQLSFVDAEMLEAMLPKLLVASEEIILLVLNNLWRERQVNVEAIYQIRMPDGLGIFDQRDRPSKANENALHRRVVEVLQNPAAFGTFTVQFARDYDVEYQRKDVHWQTTPRNNRPVKLDLSLNGNKSIMFEEVRREP